MRNLLVFPMIMIAALLFGNCASARLVEVQNGKGGTIAIKEGPFQKAEALAKANQMMAGACPSGKFARVKEYEFLTGYRTKTENKGQSTTTKSDVKRTKVGKIGAINVYRTEKTPATTNSRYQSSSNSTQTPIYEKRIDFECR